MKHTPGPWKWEKDYSAGLYSVKGEEVIDAEGDDMAHVVVNIANAKLIASAPELLENHKIIFNMIKGNFKYGETINTEHIKILNRIECIIKTATAIKNAKETK